MIEESKCCSDVMKKHFSKELVVTKRDNEDFENSTKCWICDNDIYVMIRICYIHGNVKVRGHGHITGKYRGSVHRDCHINIELNHKILAVFYNLRKLRIYI